MSVDPGAQEIDPLPRHGRVAMISLHTSPLDQPGTGDAGGMNVYVDQLARRLAARGVEVDIYTRATSSALPPRSRRRRGDRAHVHAGPFEGLAKDQLPAQLCAFAREVLRAEARHARAGTTSCTPTTGSPARSAPWPRPLERAARAHDAHDGQGQERLTRRR